MSQRQLKVLVNIGTDHQKKYAIPDSTESEGPPKQGEIISADEELANVLVNVLHVCKDYDKAADEKHKAAIRKQDEDRLEKAVASRLITPEEGAARLAALTPVKAVAEVPRRETAPTEARKDK